MERIAKRALINALGTVAYVLLIASFMFSLQDIAPKGDTIFVIASILLLLVCSAAITGFLIFGKPIMFYIDGKKREALSLLTYTLIMIVLTTLLIFLSLITYHNFL